MHLLEINRKFDSLVHKMDALTHKLTHMEKHLMAFIDDLNASLAGLKDKVAVLQTTEEGAIALITELGDLVKAQVAAGSVSPEAAAAALANIGDIVTQVNAEAVALHDAVVANTPAAPAVPAAV
jgi:hypothetical protein